MFSPTETPLEVPHQIRFDGITCYVWADYDDNSYRALLDYVRGRIPIGNSGRLSDKNLAINFFPSGFEGHDTFFGPRVEVGRNVVIGSHVSVGKETFIGREVYIGEGCTIGNNVFIGEGTQIGKDNFIPDLAEVDPGIIIPNGLLNTDNVGKAPQITQKLVDRLVRQQSSIFSR